MIASVIMSKWECHALQYGQCIIELCCTEMVTVQMGWTGDVLKWRDLILVILLFIFQGGQLLVTLIDIFGVGEFSVLFIAFFEATVIAWVYGKSRHQLSSPQCFLAFIPTNIALTNVLKLVGNFNFKVIFGRVDLCSAAFLVPTWKGSRLVAFLELQGFYLVLTS